MLVLFTSFWFVLPCNLKSVRGNCTSYFDWRCYQSCIAPCHHFAIRSIFILLSLTGGRWFFLHFARMSFEDNGTIQILNWSINICLKYNQYLINTQFQEFFFQHGRRYWCHLLLHQCVLCSYYSTLIGRIFFQGIK